MRGTFAHLAAFGGAAIVLTVGVLGIVLTMDLPMRSGPRLGPGAMPFGVSVLVALFGLGLVVQAMLATDAAPEGWRLRPIVAVTAAIVVFALGIERIGLVAASVLLIVLAIAAGPRVRWIQAAIYIPALTGLTVLVFKFLLKLSLPLWPE
jgi:hypothetical protein